MFFHFMTNCKKRRQPWASEISLFVRSMSSQGIVRFRNNFEYKMLPTRDLDDGFEGIIIESVSLLF